MRRYFLSIWASGESGKSHGFVDADPTNLRGGRGATEGGIAYDDADDAMMMDPLGRSWGSLGPSWGPSWGRLGGSRGYPKQSWKLLGPSWEPLGRSWGPVEPSWGTLGPSWGPLEPSWGPIRALLGPSWAVLGLS